MSTRDTRDTREPEEESALVVFLKDISQRLKDNHKEYQSSFDTLRTQAAEGARSDGEIRLKLERVEGLMTSQKLELQNEILRNELKAAQVKGIGDVRQGEMNLRTGIIWSGLAIIATGLLAGLVSLIFYFIKGGAHA